MSDETTTKNGFEDLLQQFFTKVPQPGETVTGKIISVDNGEVRLDIGGVTTGVVRGQELFSQSAEFNNLKVGEDIEATVIEQENEMGEMELSFRIAGYQRVWDKMETYMKDGMTLASKIVGANKGGLMMQVDALSAFMPVSQLSPENYPRVPGGDKNKILEHLRAMVGREMQVKVIDANQRDEKLIVSEKAVWEDDQKAVLESYKIGDTIPGEISALTNFGAFMKFGEGLEGLIHISEIAWQRIDHPRDVLKVGQKVEAQIIDLNKSKIYLSMKRLIEDPWKSVKDRYKAHQIVEGEIHKVEPFGLMVKLDSDIHGLAHVSELSDGVMSERQLREKFAPGQVYKFEIMNIEPAEHRLGLKLADGKKKTAAPKAEEAPAEQKAEDAPEEPKTEDPKEEEKPVETEEIKDA